MQYRALGRSGLMVSEISIGSWVTFSGQVAQEDIERTMCAAYDAGVNYFDGAEVYGHGASERAMGKVFRKVRWPRDTFLVSTKVLRIGEAPTQRGLSRKHLVEAVDAALERFGVDYVDLCFCHLPDGITPADEIVHTMNELIRRGKVLYWGTSNFRAAQILELCHIAERDHLTGPVAEQALYSMLDRHLMGGELAAVFEKHRLGSTVFSPLGQGVLTGKYNDGVPSDSRLSRLSAEQQRRLLDPAILDKVRQLSEIATDKLECSMTQLALAWCLKHPHVSTVLTGATRPEQVQENVGAVHVAAKLDEALMQRIDAILRGGTDE